MITMTRSWILFTVLLVFVPGCISAKEKGPTARSGKSTRTSRPAVAPAGGAAAEGGENAESALSASDREALGGKAVPAASPVAATTQERPTSGAGPRPLDAQDPIAAVFRDPDFQRRFAESYLSETDIEPRVTVVERDQMQLVLGLVASDKVADAITMLETRGEEAESAVFDFTLANLYFQREELDKAAAAYELACGKHPKFRRAWRNLGLVQVRRGDFAKAGRAFSKVVELGGNDATTSGLLGYCSMQAGDDLAAESAYRMAILLDPESTDWKLGLARCLAKQQRYADAAALFSTLIAKFPERIELWLAQGEAYARLNQPAKAAENFEMVDRLGGSTVDSLNNLGDLYANQQLWDLAVGAYVRALAKGEGGKPERALRAAKFLAGNGALDETATLLDGIESLHGARLEPGEKKEVLKLRARLAMASGAGAEEAKILEEVVALDPLDGDALILLGQHSARGGDKEKAAFYYERAASLENFEADAKVRHAQLLVSDGKYGAALPLLRRAQELKPRENIREYLDQVERIAAAR